jgi:biopolymer transport protein TolR
MGAFLNRNDSSSRIMSEINVTPLVDVMLVLLVIFMVTAPMMMQGVELKLPEANAKELSQKSEKLILSVNAAQKIFLNQTEISLDKLAEVLKHNAKLKEDKEIILQADQSLPYKLIVQVMAAAQGGGAENISLETSSNSHDK